MSNDNPKPPTKFTPAVKHNNGVKPATTTPRPQNPPSIKKK